MATLDLTLGALEVGVLLSSILYGIATVQAFIYSQGSFMDVMRVRLLVGLVWILETVHTAVIWVLLYSLTVTNYGHPSTLEDAPFSLALVFPFASFLGAIVQVFFAYRVRVLSGRLIIPILAWSGALLRCGLGIALCVMLLRSKTFPNFLEHYQWLLTTPLILNATVDILNTSSLCYYLLRRRPGPTFKATQRTIDKLVMYTIETGLLTSLCAVAMAVCSLAKPGTLIDFGLYMFYPKLFSNSLLTSLNTRHNLRRNEDTTLTDVQSGPVFASAQRPPDPEDAAIILELTSKQFEHPKMSMQGSPTSDSSHFEDNAADVEKF